MPNSCFYFTKSMRVDDLNVISDMNHAFPQADIFHAAGREIDHALTGLGSVGTFQYMQIAHHSLAFSS